MGSSEYSEIENEEIQKAINSGIVVVAAAGNDGNSSYEYPASYDNVISVGATDKYNKKTSFSNFNDKVSLTAPGVNILTTNINGGYSFGSGTSFSAPIVSAVAAIMKSVRPDLSPLNIKSVLQNNALDLGSSGRDDYFGYGRVDVYKTISSVYIMNPKEISVKYQSHVENIGWQNWSYDGSLAGTTGKGLRVEAIRIKIVKSN